jgi:putative membrane protein
MNKHIRISLPNARRAALASTLAFLIGSPGLLAQSGGAGSSNYGAGQSTAPSSSSSTTGTNANDASRRNTGSGYQSSSAAADADATRDINTTNAANQPTGRDSTKVGWGDRRFVTKAADAGQSELQLAQLAAERASNAEVRAYAQKLVEDHSKVNSELTTLAGQKNVQLDTDDDQSRAYKRLSKKSGTEFDQEFVEHMVDEHDKDVKMFEKASTDAKDPEIRAFASRHVEHLREHLVKAQNLQQTVMPTGRMDESSGRSTIGGSPGTGVGGATATDGTITSPSTDTTGTTSPSTSTPDTTSPDTSTNPPRDGSR